MAKRSPILGYNHNVRYRGLVFHVQTEDSGMLNPHLFTHLFYGGVIVSTRKLVYDSGSNEEAIRSLMQAQHKAAMKELRRGAFDDKIDAYLGGTPGLEPRVGAEPGKAIPHGERAATEQSLPLVIEDNSSAPIEILNDGLSEPIELPMKRPPTPEPAAPVQARTQTGDKTTRVDSKPAGVVDSPTLRAAVTAANAAAPAPKLAPGDVARAPTQLSRKPVPPPPEALARDSAPVIEMTVDDEDDEAIEQLLRGMPRDTAVEQVIPQAPPPRPASHGAATLPARSPQRAATPPPIVSSRPANARAKDDSAAQIHSPAPPSVEPPPGERAERPGQYSVNRKDGTSAAPMREKTGRIPQMHPVSKHDSGAVRALHASQNQSRVPNIPAQPPRPPTPPTGSRVPPPQAVPSRVHATAPISNRTPSPAVPAPGSGVVMTRPAVIVGAPPKAAAPPQRVRKAREDEGRGFGQGLISEKSLDEVILAYLSEDAEDK